ncbi:MAG TPA: hypothetical protein VEU08_16200, partial [Vicinamibacterales bacterium]|nr:hypothetical protein [Vicinamibacterales bacterium]
MVSQAAHVWADAVRPVPAARTISRAATADRVAFFGVVFLVLAAPFELQKPLVVLPWQSISNLEACLLLAVGCWAAALVAARAWPAWRTPVTWPWIASIAAMTAASVASTVSRVNGLHMTGRVAAACVIYLLAVNGLRTADRARTALSALVAAAAAAAVLAILEYLRIGAVIAWLHAFRTDFAWVGAQLRADGPFQYPSIASMYLEVAFACGLGLWPTDREGKRPFDGVAAT